MSNENAKRNIQHQALFQECEALRAQLDAARDALAAVNQIRDDGAQRAYMAQKAEAADLRDALHVANVRHAEARAQADELRAAFATSERNAAAMREALVAVMGWVLYSQGYADTAQAQAIAALAADAGAGWYSEAECREAMEWTRDVVQEGERLNCATILARIRAERRK